MRRAGSPHPAESAVDPNAGPYSIGSSTWPGASRVIEEAGELMQVLGKLIGAGGQTDHWDGTDLRERLIAELGDVRAALDFFIAANDLPLSAINSRAAQSSRSIGDGTDSLRSHREHRHRNTAEHRIPRPAINHQLRSQHIRVDPSMSESNSPRRR